jgi:hypothetical protein
MASSQAVGNGAYKFGAGLGRVLVYLFSKKLWIFSTTLIFVMLLCFNAGVDSWEQKSIAPLITEVGNVIVGVDNELIEKTDYLTQKEYLNDAEPQSKIKNIFQQIIGWLDLIGIVWLYFVWIKLFYHIWKFIFGDCEPWKPIGLAILTMGVLQVCYFSITLHTFYVPFQGAWHLITNSIYLIKPYSQKVMDSVEYNITNGSI